MNDDKCVRVCYGNGIARYDIANATNNNATYNCPRPSS